MVVDAALRVCAAWRSVVCGVRAASSAGMPKGRSRPQTTRSEEYCVVAVGLCVQQRAEGHDVGDALADWSTTFAALAELVPGGLRAGNLPLDLLEILPPVAPQHVFQVGANYRTHVVDLMVAQQGDTEEVRARAAAMMDQRAENSDPYVFTGLPGAICGPYDDVVLPDTGTEHDWELELAAVIGRPTYRVSRDEALSHVAGCTIVHDITTRDRVQRPGGMGTIDVAGADHVLLGTDYPFDMGVTDPLRRLDEVPGLSPDERATIAGGAAARLLGVSQAASWRFPTSNDA
ncbi:fumarylacetoacetate hydrolase family protein [Streptomyces sp. NPDC004237]|uniref:fumarylacetoacetate hydrolase family protein n=1 Tax=Streptomyces sp. NPDC004237 TaxID=3154455 RepID=UPI0033A8A530